MGLVSFSPAVPEGIGFIFYVHLFLVSVLFAYFPFSKLMHLGRRLPEPYQESGEQQSNEAAHQPLELPGKGPYLRGVRRRVQGRDERSWTTGREGRVMSEDIPRPEELSQIDYKPARSRGWTRRSSSSKGTTTTAPTRKARIPWPALRAGGRPAERGLEAPRELEGDHPRRSEGAAEEVPFASGLHGHLRPMRCVRRQVPFLSGSGDPKNMPVLRAELLRSVYRNDFTAAGKMLGKLAGGRELTPEVLKEWFYYFYQCTECRRCSVFCPYGIDTAEITMMGRELLNLVGVSIDWIIDPGGELLQDGQPPGYPAARLQGQCRILRWTTSRRSPASGSMRRSTRRAPRSSSSSRRPTTSAIRTTTASWAIWRSFTRSDWTTP